MWCVVGFGFLGLGVLSLQIGDPISAIVCFVLGCFALSTAYKDDNDGC